MVYASPLLQWLLRTVSACAEPAGATFLAVECPFFSQPLFELLGVLRMITLANPFESNLHYLAAPQQQESGCSRALSFQWHLGTDAHGEEVPPHNSDPRLQTPYRKCGAQFARSV
ncbi:hypothetical protein TNCV_4440051 [Trichonephila clavipes]|nr:hypothetical protein TNCV_4440051 [Trichonephila clavipes]